MPPPTATAKKTTKRAPKPAPAPEVFKAAASKGKPAARIVVGDCREILPTLPEVKKQQLDLVFADPPFNWARDYDRDRTGEAWDDSAMTEQEYLGFTYDWIDACHAGLRDGGALWINIPDDWAAEIVVHCKRDLKMTMVNWCVWHYRFGQNTKSRFINSKVHALYFVKGNAGKRTWNADPILETSDRRAIYADARTETKRDGVPPGLRVPMDVWYGKYWGRIQGNNKERRHKHDNQLPEVYLERVVLACSNAGDTVLDPFTGTGTTGVVARALGRKYVGTEYARLNAERALQRIKAGPVRELGTSRGMSTAIHAPRRGSSPNAP